MKASEFRLLFIFLFGLLVSFGFSFASSVFAQTSDVPQQIQITFSPQVSEFIARFLFSGMFHLICFQITKLFWF